MNISIQHFSGGCLLQQNDVRLTEAEDQDEQIAEAMCDFVNSTVLYVGDTIKIVEAD